MFVIVTTLPANRIGPPNRLNLDDPTERGEGWHIDDRATPLVNSGSDLDNLLCDVFAAVTTRHYGR